MDANSRFALDFLNNADLASQVDLSLLYSQALFMSISDTEKRLHDFDQNARREETKVYEVLDGMTAAELTETSSEGLKNQIVINDSSSAFRQRTIRFNNDYNYRGWLEKQNPMNIMWWMGKNCSFQGNYWKKDYNLRGQVTETRSASFITTGQTSVTTWG